MNGDEPRRPRKIVQDASTGGNLGLAFLVCFWRPMVTLGQDWLHRTPDAGMACSSSP